MMNNSSKTAKSLRLSIILVIVLSVCLAITTLAIVYSMVIVDENLFTTGRVSINLNDGEQIMTEGEFIAEPGATYKKEFFIENQSTCEVYYRLYFENVSGGLAKVLQVKICDGDKVLAEGTPHELTQSSAVAAEIPLSIDEHKTLQIYFYFPAEAGNSAQDQSLLFDLAADAVQVKNNPNKEFD